MFTFKKRSNNVSIEFWVCSNKCKVCIRIDFEPNKFTKQLNEHCHDSDTALVAATNIVNKMKEQTTQTMEIILIYFLFYFLQCNL